MPQKVLIYHTALSKEATPDDLDVKNEAEFVSDNLKNIGYKVEKMPFNFKSIDKEIKEIKPSFIFNLVEAIGGKDSLAYLAPLNFERLRIPYTGCTSSSFIKTENKLSAKREMKREGILTPYWITSKDFKRVNFLNKKFIVKSNIDHASKNLESTLLYDKDELKNLLLLKGKDFFAEEYIDGREFNISIIGPLKKGKVLSPAEIIFSNWSSDKPKIVDYAAKWDETSHGYKNTNRSFEFLELDKPLLKNLTDICKKCWNIFDLRGYARVDFRIDKGNKPYVLEINTNPCISPDAGFVAAARKTGMSDEDTLRSIIRNSCGEKFVL